MARAMANNEFMYMTETEFIQLLNSQTPSTDDQDDAILDYVDCGYDINIDLRCKVDCPKAEELNKSFKSITSNSKPFYLLRGIPNLVEEGLLDANGNLNDQGFCSTTFSTSVAEQFVRIESKTATCCMIHIHCPANKPVKLLPICICKANKQFAYEKEVLLAKGTTLKKITDENLITDIAKAMNYTIDHHENKIYKTTDNSRVILMQIESQNGGAGGLIKILGRNRKLIKKRNTLYIRYMNEIITLAKARKIEQSKLKKESKQQKVKRV
jgi:hypothetical protein